MKRSITYIASSILAFWLLHSLTACEVETHAKGNIDGNWYLVQIDTLQTGSTIDVREARIFWGIQTNLVQLKSYYKYENIFILRFNMKDDNTLLLYEPRFNDRENHDPEVKDIAFLTHFGINELQETFLIEQLTTSKMRLKSSKLRLYFEKF